MIYFILASENEKYTGKDYIYQGEKYAIFDKKNYKKYKSLKVANKVLNRLLNTCSNVSTTCLNGYTYAPIIVEVEE